MDAYGSGGNPHTTGTHGTTLTDRAVRMWPTATASDAEGNGMRSGEHGPPDQTTTTAGPNGPAKADLNPRFVAALMGVPWDWLNPSTSVETDSCLEWQRKHSPPWRLEVESAP